MDKGVSGFSTAGILPFNLDKFSEVDFILEVIEPLVIDEDQEVAIEPTSKNIVEENGNDAVEEPVNNCRPVTKSVDFCRICKSIRFLVDLDFALFP